MVARAQLAPLLLASLLSCSEDAAKPAHFAETSEGGDARCATSCAPNMECGSNGTCACLAGYADCDLDPANGCECDDASGGTTTGCEQGCDAGQVCSDEGQCEFADNAAVVELRLERQFSELPDANHPDVGEIVALLFRNEPLPQDHRDSYKLAAGVTCHYEVGTSYPHQYDGKTWPSEGGGRRLDAGTLTVSAAGAPGDIVLEAHRDGSRTKYRMTEPEQQGYSLTSFERSYAPIGAAFEVRADGGRDIDAGTLGEGRLPGDFAIDRPEPEEATSYPIGRDLEISWSPAEPGATMLIRLEKTTTSQSGIRAGGRLSCLTDDTGSLTIPLTALRRFDAGTEVYLQLRRMLDQNSVDGSSGTERTASLHVRLTGTVERTRKMRFE